MYLRRILDIEIHTANWKWESLGFHGSVLFPYGNMEREYECCSELEWELVGREME